MNKIRFNVVDILLNSVGKLVESYIMVIAIIKIIIKKKDEYNSYFYLSIH